VVGLGFNTVCNGYRVGALNTGHMHRYVCVWSKVHVANDAGSP
jgi:hypothetical protein